MENKKHNINWEKEWLEGNISSQEAADMASMPDSFEAFEKFIEGAQNFEVPQNLSQEEAWLKLENRIAEQSSAKVISITRRNWILGIAASFILAIGAFFLLPTDNGQIYWETGLAQNKTITLPDGSSVYLNAVSSVKFSKENWENNRIIELSGEAFFEVEKGSKFTVITSTGSVEVLGTSFNVRDREQILSVACKTGKVRVKSARNDLFEDITPGQYIRVNQGELTDVEEINADRIALWRNNEFDFESLATKEVFAELERQYNITITSDFTENELKETFTATLPTDNLQEAVETIGAIKRLKAEFLNNGQTVRFYRE